MRVLVIDDEPQIRRALRADLERNGFTVQSAGSGDEGLDMASISAPDLVILDLAMPGTDGFAVCAELRKWSKVPIIVLSVRDDEEDKIKALDLGADDYLTKPFGVGELQARIRAVVRRAAQDANDDEISFSSGDLHIDFVLRTVSIGATEIHLTPIEYDLLKYLVSHRNRVLTHRQLLTKVWGPEYTDETHTLRVHIANLRFKIESNPTRPVFIHTETRIGYRFRHND
jgi:two-component system, OmpR family, KDP operon response regulator KdpE